MILVGITHKPIVHLLSSVDSTVKFSCTADHFGIENAIVSPAVAELL